MTHLDDTEPIPLALAAEVRRGRGRPPGVSYDEEAHDKAFQLWAFVHGRNFAAVAKALQADFPGLDERTIAGWAKADGWPDRVAR